MIAHKLFSSFGLQTYKYLTQEALLLPILAIFLFTACCVSPQAEFALNDDWIHAKAVQRLLQEGFYRGHPYVVSTLIAQAYWGALFCKLFGFSFTTLRISTLVLAVVGGWAVAKSARVLGIQHHLALLTGILYAINPIMLSLSYSFMTDIPMMCLSALSGLCFLYFFRSQRLYWVGLGSSFAVIGFFVRQFAIVPPMAFLLVLLILWLRQSGRLRWSTVGILAAPWMAGALFYLWFSSVKEVGTSTLIESKHPYGAALEAIRHYPVALCYLGFFALPLGLGLIWQFLKGYAPWNRGATVFLLGFANVSLATFLLPSALYLVRKADWLLQFPARMPLLTYDYLYDLSVSNPHLQGRYPLPAMQIQEWWWLFTMVSLVIAGLVCLGGYRLLCYIWNWRKQRQGVIQIEAQQQLFLLLWMVVYLSIIYNPWRPSVDDRLLLPAIEPFLLLLAYSINCYRHQVALRIATLATLCFYLFSLSGLQGHFAWNHAALAAQNKLLNTYHVSPEVIRGTDTFNGWYNSDKYMQVYNTKDFWQANSTGLGPWTFDNEYIITSLDKLDGYQPLEHFPYFVTLGMKQQTITIFKRDTTSN